MILTISRDAPDTPKLTRSLFELLPNDDPVSLSWSVLSLVAIEPPFLALPRLLTLPELSACHITKRVACNVLKFENNNYKCFSRRLPVNRSTLTFFKSSALNPLELEFKS